MCPQLVQINFSPLRLSRSTSLHLLQVWLVYCGLTLSSLFPDFAARYSSFLVKSYQLGSERERFKPRLADRLFGKHLPLLDLIGWHRFIIFSIGKSSAATASYFLMSLLATHHWYASDRKSGSA